MLGPFNNQIIKNDIEETVQIIDLDNNIKNEYTDKINIINLEDELPLSNSSNIFINYDKKDNMFNIYNNKKDKIGFFTLEHLVRYILGENGNYNNIDQTNYQLSKDLIDTFIIKDMNNNELYDYTESTLMGDLNILIRINTLLEKTPLNDILLDVSNKNELKDKFNNIRSKFMSNTLKNISDIKNINNNHLNNKLVKYSTKLLNDIIDITQTKLNTYQKENTDIYDALNNCKELRQMTNKKIDNLNLLIEKQNENLVNMTETINKYKKNTMHGGKRTTSSKYKTTDSYETDSYEEISIKSSTDSYSNYYTPTSSNTIDSSRYNITSKTSRDSRSSTKSQNNKSRIDGIYEL